MRPNESFIEQPVRSLQTMLRVLSEGDHTLPTVVPDGIYGPNTMNAVTAFQRREGLPVTGVVNEYTWDSLVNAYELALIYIGKAEPIEVLIDPGEVFCYGDTNPYLYLAQAMLAQLSLDCPSITAPNHNATMDREMQRSIEEFQGMSGLAQTGELDRNTWRHLVHHFTLSSHNTIGKQKGSVRKV